MTERRSAAELNSTGAVPLYAAKWRAVANRVTLVLQVAGGIEP